MKHQQKCIRRSSSASSRKRGITTVEMIISAALLCTLMSFVTTICFQISFVWRDISHHRVALGELSNQLEQITGMSQADATSALESLEPSAACARTLKSPVLTSEVIEDDFGSQIVLRINWDRKHPGKPVELAGWISDDVASSSSEDDQ